MESPYGQMLLDSKFYIERPPNEDSCCQMITKPGALIRIKAPRQMGKSSLMGYILNYTRQQHYRTVTISFQGLDESIFKNLDHFLRSFCELVTLQLDLKYKPKDNWKGLEGSKPKCTSFFQKCVLPEKDILGMNKDTPFVLALDEVDLTFQHLNIAREFLSLLRSWNEKKNDSIWEKLRLIITHSQEVYMFLDARESPFNVGLPIELPEFTQEQLLDLATRHGLLWTVGEVDQLRGLVGGHPFLARVALYEIALGKLTLERLLRIAPTREGPYTAHLNHHHDKLREKPALLAAFKQVIAVDSPVRLENEETFKLHGMGLVKYVGNDVTPFCELYRRYFLDIL